MTLLNVPGGGKRLAYLDALKCFGILLVVSWHVLFFGMDINARDSSATLFVSSFFMPLFFFVSGFLAFKENEIGNINEFKKIWNKFLFLVLPTIAFYVVINIKEQGGGILDFMRAGFGRYWFTFTLFEIFVIYYIVISVSRSKTVLALMLVILSIIGVGYLSFFSSYDVVLLDFRKIGKFFQFFSLGVFAKMFAGLYDKLIRNEYLKAFTMVSFFVLLFSLFHVNMPNVLFHFFRDIVLKYLGLYVVISFFYCNQDVFNKSNRLNNLIIRIGQNSLAIYMIHYFFLPDFSAYPEWLNGLDWVSIYAVSFAYTFFIIALCMFFIELLSNSIFVKKYILGKK